MQTLPLDSISLLWILLGAGFIIQVITAFFILRTVFLLPERMKRAPFIWLALGFMIILAGTSIASIFMPTLQMYSSGILLASALMLAFSISLFVFFSRDSGEDQEAGIFVSETELIVPDDYPEDEKSENDDRLISLGKEFLAQVSESISGEVNIVRLVDFINDELIKNTAADGGVFFLVDDFDDIISSKSFKGSFPPPYKLPEDLPHKPVRVETNFRYIQFNVGETIFGEVAANGEPVLVEDGQTDERIYTNGPEEFLQTGSYIFVPVMVKARVVGVLGLARLPGKEPFTQDDFRTARVLAEYSGAAINNIYTFQEVLEHAELEREAGTASHIQKTLQPKRLPDLPEIGFGSFFTPAKGVCGDYYDIILARRDRISIVIGDVAGKGINSSIVMIMIRSILQLVTNTTKTAATILDWINKGITGKIDMDHYASLTLINYRPEDHSMEYASAGHQPMLLWKAESGTIEKVHQKTDPIGVERTSVYSDLKLTVGKGDIIILFTDGLVEALDKNGRQYGINSLSKIVTENNGLSAKDLAAMVKQNIQEFVGSASIHDDQTLVVVKIKA
ncbi:PP2C family protein-serine/threonine phosphatase [Brucepastera parasyntrophica]|uniref:GAF domain-containing SpoIIE family protein phosphatase n=1 Tax=Brucepastera parasyntrophica TaxID=2880008 RepID=UPI00210D6C1D|nr:SpoIIE family protein phosphatase [Brucepastera parasyntrophica]ULQ60145.1 PP2C family protein-serine/threonine phosphatase [Brucepastera parasyntrophica]